jgi:predicted ester cyclase
MAETPDMLARRWFHEVWVLGDESAIDRLMHPQGIAHGLTAEPIHGPEQFKPYHRALKTALRGIEIDVARTVVQGDTCAVHCHVRATHAGDTLGGPGTGRGVDFWGVTIFRATNGQIVEGWNCYDFLTMYQQIGWVPNPVLPA